MIRKRVFRRTIGALLLAAGVLLMWFAPESPAGVALLAAGIVLEAVGLRLERSSSDTRKRPDAMER